MLSIKNLSVKLDAFSLKNINLEVVEGDYFVMAGPSGSGKTILLESIAGMYEKHTSGDIFLFDEDLRKKKIQERNVGLVFQANTLFPHLSVKKNIEFALNLRYRKNRNHRLFNSICEQLFLFDLLDRDPKTLSGGEIQRVLLARTLASEPKIILLDEPLTGVDTHQKDHLKTLLRNLNRTGQTIIHVTHDFEETFSLANKMGIMHNGELISRGTPEEILTRPANEFVARFCGYLNYFKARTASPNKISISDKISINYSSENPLPSISAIIIDELKIEVIDLNLSPKKENIFTGKVKDVFMSVKGLELAVDIGIHLRVVLPSVRKDNRKYMPGDEVSLHLPNAAIDLI